jgi:NAD(P)-dependent dehydrogenase (short-subunit alcohol dehydrogenase family)
MEKPKYRSALIVGTGPGLSASLARLFAGNGLAVAVAARQTDKLAALAKETGASVHACNAAEPKEVAALFQAVEAKGGAPDIVVYNASSRVRAPLIDVAPEDARRALEVSAFGAFLVSQEAARRMLPKKHGAIFLTGATAGVKGFAQRELAHGEGGRLREGLRAVGHLRHGQVRAARAGAIDGA